ncbi:MAG: hypothetical protein HN509_13555 [Halobacteriovoraceae bacterium]|jgi:hypothetical protein|nr:hypothetical protein [Halobacteriovoraceae bacterium]MBT5094440.1 hypothetical protein [Halobacteriovoraceae bacterium]
MKILAIFLLISTSVMAQSGQRIDKKNRIIYKYKKYQKFDFEDLVIQGETGSPGDISVDPRKNFDFKNKLPYRRNFNAEIRKGIERIR